MLKIEKKTEASGFDAIPCVEIEQRSEGKKEACAKRVSVLDVKKVQSPKGAEKWKVLLGAGRRR